MRRGLVALDHRDGDEFPQVVRVLRVLSRVDGATLQKIVSAHDHKGTLHVAWEEEPNVSDMARVEIEWGIENEYVLYYNFPDGQQLYVETNRTVRSPA